MTAPVRQHRSRPARRSGAAAVEFAVAAPVLFLFFFSALEFGRMHMIRHTMQNAAYEAARHGLAANVTDDEIHASAQSILNTASVRKSHIHVDQGSADLTVTISAPFREQGWFSPLYFKNTVLVSTMTLIKDVED